MYVSKQKAGSLLCLFMNHIQAVGACGVSKGHQAHNPAASDTPVSQFLDPGIIIEQAAAVIQVYSVAAVSPAHVRHESKPPGEGPSTINVPRSA